MTPGKPGRPITSMQPWRVKERAVTESRRLLHRCIWCERKMPATRDRVLCVACATVSKERQRVLRERRQKNKECRECGVRTDGPARCKKCERIRNARPSRTRAAQNAQRRRWYAKAMRDPVRREQRRAVRRQEWRKRTKARVESRRG